MLFAETLCQCSELFFSLGFYQSYAALIDRALVLISPLTPQTADLHFQLGQVRRRQEDLPTAIKHYEASLQAARKIAAPDRIATALFGLGRATLESERLIEADMWLQDAISYYEVSTDKLGLAEVLVLSAKVQWSQGHMQAAEKFLKSALHTAGELRDHRQQAKIMSAIYLAWGQMYEQSGNVERATEQYHMALDLTKDIYDQQAEAEVRASLGVIYERIGKIKLAEEHLSKAMTIRYDLKLLEHWAEDNLRLAGVAEAKGKLELRDFHIGQACQMYRQLGNRQKLEMLGENEQ
jgi:tetratricopeptide (TPR) repeat protein